MNQLRKFTRFCAIAAGTLLLLGMLGCAAQPCVDGNGSCVHNAMQEKTV